VVSPVRRAHANRPAEEITEGDLVLARWRAEDLEQLRAVVEANSEHLSRWMVWAQGGSSVELAGFLTQSAERWESGERFEYSISSGPGRTLIGGAGLMARVGAGGLELGYWVDERHARRRVATRAAGMLVTAAFRLRGVDHVEIRHDAANEASAGIPALLGFRRLGTFPVKPRGAPAETGAEARWRLDASEFRRLTRTS
jgi:RimJ/RimL family protein N-acetyltransferase